jgi:hypothetical protein
MSPGPSRRQLSLARRQARQNYGASILQATVRLGFWFTLLYQRKTGWSGRYVDFYGWEWGWLTDRLFLDSDLEVFKVRDNVTTRAGRGRQLPRGRSH